MVVLAAVVVGAVGVTGLSVRDPAGGLYEVVVLFGAVVDDSFFGRGTQGLVHGPDFVVHDAVLELFLLLLPFSFGLEHVFGGAGGLFLELNGE